MEPSSIHAAAAWLRYLLTGQAASVLATIAVAVLGLAVMAGHLPVRRGIEVVMGICIIFGAPIIAAGLSKANPAAATTLPPAAPATSIRTRPPAATVYDPYAGASVPQYRAAPSDILAPVQ